MQLQDVYLLDSVRRRILMPQPNKTLKPPLQVLAVIEVKK